MATEELNWNFDDMIVPPVEFTKGKVKYHLVEASGGAVRAYRNAMLKAVKLGPEGKPASMEGMSDSELLLVSMCVYPVKDDGELSKQNITVETLKNWPHRIQHQLLKQVKLMSPIDTDKPKGPTTKEELETEIKKLQDQLEKVLAGKAGDDDLGKS